MAVICKGVFGAMFVRKMLNLSDIYFTADVAKILDVPEWRVIRFAAGNEYQITPSQSDAAGSGTRRLYDLENICEMALALKLLDSGLSSKTIGEILQRLKTKGNERLSARLELNDLQLRYLYLAIFRPPKRSKYWSRGGREVFFISGLQEALIEQAERPEDDLLLVSVGATFQKLIRRLKKFQKTKRKGKINGSI
jgi:DNA-binding transcriptional MerR regulator